MILITTGLVVAFGGAGMLCPPAAAESPGLADLDDAVRTKMNARGVLDLNKVIDLLQISLDKGLDTEDTEFAQMMMSDSLMQRASALVRVINTRSMQDERVQGIFRLVVSDLRRVLAFDDPPADASFLLGKLMALPGGDPHESRRALSKYLETTKLRPDRRAEALVLRAGVQADEAKAMADIDEAIKLTPDNGNYRLVRAVYLRGRKKLDQALAAVEIVLEKNPDDANALILQGELRRDLGNTELALESFQRAIELSPKSPGPYQHRGEIYRSLGEHEMALVEFNKVLELQPGELLTHVHRAESYLRSGRYEEALADVDLVLEKQPLAWAHRIRAEVLSNTGLLQEAIDELVRDSAAKPDQLDLKSLLALFYQVDGRHRKEIEVYNQVLDQQSDNFLALRSRGDAYLTIGEHAKAIADFEQTLKKATGDPALLNNLAWVLATSPDAEVRNGRRAVELATKACELTNYKQAHILSTLAAAFAESGDFGMAIEWSEKAVGMDHSDQLEQLTKELASYRGGQPWRERQTSTKPQDSSTGEAATSNQND
jgi:tetratricopeptide (TPR) repeat protein